MNISRFFPYKCIRNQIWPCHKVGQARFNICANMVETIWQMLHTKSQGHWPYVLRIRYSKGFYHIWVWWPWPFILIYSHCLIRFNISSENNDFGFNSIQKINFSKKFTFKCNRKQIWPWPLVSQGQFKFIIWTNLVGPTSPMLHTKSQGHRPSGSGEEDF